MCNLPHNFLCFISTTMFPHKVLTTRRVHVHVRTLRDGCVHTFLTYEVMSMRNFKHITPCLSHYFPPMYLKRNTTTRLLNYEPFSACNYWHMKPCLSTLFDQYDGLWGVFTVRKRHKFTQRFDLQGHCLCAMCRHLISICFMTSVVFPRKYHDSVMFMHKFAH